MARAFPNLAALIILLILMATLLACVGGEGPADPNQEGDQVTNTSAAAGIDATIAPQPPAPTGRTAQATLSAITSTLEPTPVATLTPPPIPTSTPPPYFGEWSTVQDNINALTRRREVMISLHQESGDAVRLYVRCQDSELELFVIWKWHTLSGGQIIELAQSKPVRYKVGDSEIEELEWDLSTHELGPYLMGTYLPSRHVPGMVQRLYNASEFVLEVTPQNSEPIVGVFNPEGLYWASKPILEACGPGSADTKTPTKIVGTHVLPTTEATAAPSDSNMPTPGPELTSTPASTTVAQAVCCISIGSREQEVLDLIGHPDEVVLLSRTEEYWHYNDLVIIVHPSQEVIIGWDYSGPLKLSPFKRLSSIEQTPRSNRDGLIATGSTVDEVVAVMGEPESVFLPGWNQESWWQYDDTTIYISPDGQTVTSWSYSGPIHNSQFEELALVTTIAGSDPEGKIAVGSTMNQVMSAMGEPSGVFYWSNQEDAWWQYHDGTVYISPARGQVTSWTYTGPLEASRYHLLSGIRAVPNSNPSGKLGRGSTIGEVVAILGEPDSVAHWGEGQDTWWSYYQTTVYIDPESKTVTDWLFDGSPLQNPFK